MSKKPDLSFCKRLPKIELHAHLTGSIPPSVFQEIYDQRISEDPALIDQLPNPAVLLADEKAGQDINSFFAHFTPLYALLSTISSLQYATRRVLELFAEDGVVYLELRTTPRALPGTTTEESVRAVLDIIRDWNDLRGEEMRVNLLLSVDRSRHSAKDAEDIVDLALHLRDEGYAVVGIDLSGDPNSPTSVNSFRPAFTRAKSSGLGLALHFAELPISSTRSELEELLSWHPDRLGHLCLVADDLRKLILQREIGVELCLTCNVLSGMLPGDEPGFASHHFGWWWAQQGRVSLGTDDAGIFASWNSGEHLVAAQHFDLTTQDLVGLSTRAAASILGGAGDKARLTRILAAYGRDEVASA
ncbi:hypothetical protein BCR39DRAFT_511328 [Naematelia encephala]|uniref:Adenosine deaminase domain-containing protein n=1 Tax=Naematelia encephala TaxID=71784 RepID=A0A1Y2BLL6_9TREE|nr:hypothetical protein BCR39DRAFT_511328 [Naematelia encephala]